MAEDRQIIERKRIRKINGSFSWIDHSLITGGFLEDLSLHEIVLYFFLVAVSDRNGISFYSDDRICRLLKIDLSTLGEAREYLIYRSLIAYKYPVYQVLSLPPKPVSAPTEEELAQEKTKKDFFYIRKIKTIMGRI